MAFTLEYLLGTARRTARTVEPKKDLPVWTPRKDFLEKLVPKSSHYMCIHCGTKRKTWKTTCRGYLWQGLVMMAQDPLRTGGKGAGDTL